MDAAHARRLLEYDTWATTRVLDACAALSPEEWTREVISSFPSVAATLGHVAGAKWVWLQRLGGTSLPMPEWTKTASLAELRERLAAIDRDWDAHVQRVGDDGLAGTLAYRNLAGDPYEKKLADIVTHLVNHGTYHRGQVTTQLRHLGAKAPSTDFIYFA
jgi:uncharacterized damage-inducible protein DinB